MVFLSENKGVCQNPWLHSWGVFTSAKKKKNHFYHFFFYYEMLPAEKMQRMINIWTLSTPIFSKPLCFVILKKKIPMRRVTGFLFLEISLKIYWLIKMLPSHRTFPGLPLLVSSLIIWDASQIGKARWRLCFLVLCWPVALIARLKSFKQRSMGPCLFLLVWFCLNRE